MAVRDGQLETLLRYRENIRDQYRQLMSQLLADGRRLEAERKRFDRGHEEALRSATQSETNGVVDISQSVGRRQHAAHQREMSLRVQRQIDLNEQHIDLCRESLTKADQDVQALVKLQDKRRQEHEAKVLRSNQFELEDTWAGTQAARN